MWSHQSATYHERFETFGKRRLPTVWTSEAWNCPGVTCTSSPCVHFSRKFMSSSDCGWPSCSPSLQCLLTVGEFETQPTQPMHGEASFPLSLVQRSLEVLEVWVIHLDESNLKDKSQSEQTLHWQTRLRYSWCKLSGLQAGFAENWNNSDFQYKKHTSHKLLLLMKSPDWVDGQKQQNPSWKIYYDILQQALAWGSTFAASGADLASCEVALGNSLGRPSTFVFLQDCKCEQITILRHSKQSLLEFLICKKDQRKTNEIMWTFCCDARVYGTFSCIVL